MQYFYIVGYTLIGNDLTVCKVSLNEHALMSWARREATKYDFRTYKLYKQPITRTGKITFVKQIKPFKKPIDIQTSIVPFDWGEFEESQRNLACEEHRTAERSGVCLFKAYIPISIENYIKLQQMEPKPKKDDHDRLDPGHKIGLLILLFIFMLFVTRACAQTAQYDTAIVKYQNIERIVSQTSDKGAVRYYAVYNDKQENISELIPVSKTVLSYINACKQNQIEPSLAIRLKNGIIVGLIRYKTKYIVKRKR